MIPAYIVNLLVAHVGRKIALVIVSAAITAGGSAALAILAPYFWLPGTLIHASVQIALTTFLLTLM